MNAAERAARDVPPESVIAAADLLARITAEYPAHLVPEAVGLALAELLVRTYRAGLRVGTAERS